MADKKKDTKTNDSKQDTGTGSIEGKTIDERMADLLKDHKRMGAR